MLMYCSLVLAVLLVCSIACALLAHFGPGKFPANWSAVLACVVAYLVITAVLNVFCYVKEGDSFLITHPLGVSCAPWDCVASAWCAVARGSPSNGSGRAPCLRWTVALGLG
jgi:hypothetical protein